MWCFPSKSFTRSKSNENKKLWARYHWTVQWHYWQTSYQYVLASFEIHLKMYERSIRSNVVWNSIVNGVRRIVTTKTMYGFTNTFPVTIALDKRVFSLFLKWRNERNKGERGMSCSGGKKFQQSNIRNWVQKISSTTNWPLPDFQAESVLAYIDLKRSHICKHTEWMLSPNCWIESVLDDFHFETYIRARRYFRSQNGDCTIATHTCWHTDVR